MSSPYGPPESGPSASQPVPPPSGPSSPAEAGEQRPVVIVPPEPSSTTPPPDAGAQNYYRPSVPAPPNQMVMRPTSLSHAVVRGALAVFLVIAGVLNLFWGARFPGNAPVESFYNLGIAVDLFGSAVVLGIFAILAAARRSVPVKPQSTSPMAIAALVLSTVVLVIWLVSGLVPVLASVSNGERYQYMSAVGAIVFLGIPWSLGMIFGALSLRSGGRRTVVLGGTAIAIGVVLVIAAVASAVLYGLGLTD